MAAAVIVIVALVWWPAASLADAPGQVYAFGDNQYGELGSATANGTPTPNPVPALVGLPGGAGAVRAVAAGTFHSLALAANGQLYAFGLNRYGQLGNATNTNTDNANPTPTLVGLPGATGPPTVVAAGGDHSLAVTATGQLYGFGANTFGQLGNATGAGTAAPNPTPTLIGLPGATGPVTAVSAGADHTLALTSTGQLYAFGLNNYGQLGNPTNIATPHANPVPTLVVLPGASGPVTAIAAGAFFSLAVTSSGQLYAFGNNHDGQLGSTANTGTATANPTPALVALPGASAGTVAIAAGASHSLALTANGQLFAFGYNRYGQLGNATNTNTGNPNPTPTLVGLPGTPGLAAIGAGSDQSLVLTSAGQVYAFGFNLYGQLGVTTSSGTSSPVPAPTAIGVPAGTTIDRFAPGSTAGHTLVVVADLAVSSAALPSGRVGVGYAARVNASGGAAPYRWRATGLPPGLSLDPASGAVAGTPAASGTYPVLVSVADAWGVTASVQVAVTIAPAGPSAASIRALLIRQLAPRGRLARIPALLRHHGYTESVQAVSAGGVVIAWYFLPRGARLPRSRPRAILVAIGRASFRAPGATRLTIKLTGPGRRLLAKATRLVLTARGVFTPAGGAPITAVLRFSLRR
jgi:alpha-tubulin suppressor-like RCC1 family protein